MMNNTIPTIHAIAVQTMTTVMAIATIQSHASVSLFLIVML